MVGIAHGKVPTAPGRVVLTSASDRANLRP